MVPTIEMLSNHGPIASSHGRYPTQPFHCPWCLLVPCHGLPFTFHGHIPSVHGIEQTEISYQHGCSIDMWIAPMVGTNHEMLSNMDQWQAPVVCASTIPCSLAVVHGACWCHAMGSPLLPMAPLKLPWVHHLATCQVSMAWSS